MPPVALKDKKPCPEPSEHTLARICLSFLRDYTWIEEHRKTKALMADLQDLKDSRERTLNLPNTRAELLANAKEHYSRYQNERVKMLQNTFATAAPGEDIFRRLLSHRQLISHNVGTRDFGLYVAWDEVKTAIETMPEDDSAISGKHREKALKHIDDRIRDAEKELEKIFPKESRFRVHGGDVRDDFIEHWIRIQRQCDGPVSPTGYALKFSSPSEIRAHEKLRIGDFVNRDAAFQARN